MKPTLVILALVLSLGGCDSSKPKPPQHQLEQVAAKGLENVIRMSANVFSGSSPHDAIGFQSIRDLGIKTIISVDGSIPDCETARQYGLRYVHLPIGYDGIRDERIIELAKALRDLHGPVYVHCHHGKHRGPAAAAVALRCLDPAWTPERHREFLELAGTDPKYTGLMATADCQLPKLDDSKCDYREVADIPSLTRRMVELDHLWERIQASPTVPDARLLVEAYQELKRDSDQRSQTFRDALDLALIAAGELERALEKPNDPKELIKRSARACSNCHTSQRDRSDTKSP